MKRVDLNCDLGESFGAYAIGRDAEVIPYISSANVACGFHASDPCVMRKTVALARQSGVAVGAHPGLPDLQGFGRRSMDISGQEAKDFVLYQLGALAAFCKAESIALSHVKMHGALYNMAGKDYKLALAACEAIAEFDPSLILLGLSGSAMLRAAAEVGIASAREVFADRAYEEDGSLVARSKPGAMIAEEGPAVERVLTMVREGRVRAITGALIPIEADSICLHGDSPQALAFARDIRAALEAEGVEIAPLAKLRA
jgi:UPF0271 protein